MSGLGHFQTGLYGRVTQIKIVTDSHAASSIGSEHGAVSAPTVNMIVRRDSSGRADIVAPAAADNTTKIPTTAWVTTEIGASGGGTVTNIVTGIGLTGGPITTTGTIDLANTSVVAASYTFTNLTVDAQGRLTSASNGSLPIASETVQGIVERATQAEVDAGTDAIRFISPARLQAKVATDTALGIVERATQAEVDTGSDTTRFISPARLQAKVASETALGIVERATQAEVDAGTDTTRYISPDTLESNLTTSGALSFSKKKTADESVANSGVVQDDDHLVSIGPMAAGAYYAFEAYLLFSIGTPGSGDIRTLWVFSDTPQLSHHDVHYVNTDGVQVDDSSAMTTVVAYTIASIGLLGGILMRGFILSNASTGGTLKLQWAQRTGNSNATIHKEGSWVKITRLS